MAWFADLAGKAESLLNNLDEQTGVAIRNHNKKSKNEFNSESNWNQRTRPTVPGSRKFTVGEAKSSNVNNIPSRQSSPTRLAQPTHQPWYRDSVLRLSGPRKNSPTRKNTQYHLSNCPRTLVNDVPGDMEFFDEAKLRREFREAISTNTGNSPVRQTSTTRQSSPIRQSSPTRQTSHTHQARSRDSDIGLLVPRKKSPPRKNTQYHLNNCPRTLVNDIDRDKGFLDGVKMKRCSQSLDLDSLSGDGWSLRMQNLEVENAMLKNELNVMNREVSELLEQLRKAEDGNDVVSEDANITHMKLDAAERENHMINLDKEVFESEVDKLKAKIDEITTKKDQYLESKSKLDEEMMRLTDVKKDYEEKIEDLQKQKLQLTTAQMKLENDYRHAQSVITELQSNLDKSNAECQRLETDWEAYKLRVKSQLFAKDNQIKSLQEGLTLTEDTKILMEQIDSLKYERNELSEAIAGVRTECETMKRYMSQVDTRYEAAERVVAAIRDALKEERVNKNRLEAQYAAVAKELKTIQMETGQTIASLRTALRDKDNELMHLRESISNVKTPDTSSLNVADYNVTQDTADTDKIQFLTETLFQRQAKIDKLMADNNMLKIQMNKLESKLKTESGSRTNSHSVLNLQTDCRQRRHASDSTMQVISTRMAAVVKRYPAFRIFIILYMFVLHFWVLTVLLTNIPETYIPRSMRSS